jgi:hypothetical protein
MRHARDDYNRIQDPAGLIPDGEPVFLLRGQDVHASSALRFYAVLIDSVNGSPEVARLTREQADRMDEWPKKKEQDL